MNKKELAKRWHVTERAINSIIKNKELTFDRVLSDNNVRNKVDFDIEEIKRFEKLKNIPSDPMNTREAEEYLGVTNEALREFKFHMRNVGEINSRLFLFSRAELKEWRKLIKKGRTS